jgi:hypothetical protein
MMTNDERMQRESNLIATIRKTLPDFRKRARMDGLGVTSPRCFRRRLSRG